MLRMGIAGVGGLGQLHLTNYLKRADVEVAALASRTGQLRAVETNLGKQGVAFDTKSVPIYTGYEKLCADPNLDAISVNLPTDLHADAAIRALDAGKHVFSEKPMARTPDQARQMIAAAKKSGKILMIGHCLRFFPEYVKADELIRSGRYGRVIAASFARCGGRPAWGSEDWFNNPKRSGGAVVDLHIHDADIAVWWWGKPARISAVGSGPNIVHSQWHYPNGPIVQFESTWDRVTASPFYFNFKIILEQASLVYDTRTSKGLQLATEKSLETVELPALSGYVEEDNYFLDAVINGGARVRLQPEDSVVALECVTETARQIEGQ